MIDGARMDQSGDQRDRAKWMDSRHSLEIELIRFANGCMCRLSSSPSKK